MEVKNISGKKLDVGGFRLCAGHILNLKNDENVSPLITAGLIEVVEE